MRCNNCDNYIDTPGIWPPCKFHEQHEEILENYDPEMEEPGESCPKFKKLYDIKCKNCINFKPVRCKNMEKHDWLLVDSLENEKAVNQYTVMDWCDGYMHKVTT
jgi:hypothetical protein